MRLQIDVTFSREKVLLVLIAAELALVLADLTVYVFNFAIPKPFQHLFDLTLEANIPTWFSSTQLLVVGIVSFLVSRQRHALGLKRAALAWLVISAFFAYMGIDDASQIHERLATGASQLAKQTETDSGLLHAFIKFPSYYWQVIFLPIFGSLGIFMLVFLHKELGKGASFWLFFSGLACYVIAVGLDYYDGLKGDNYKLIANYTVLSLQDVQHVLRVLEEYIELLGTTLFLGAFMKHLEVTQGKTRPTMSRGMGRQTRVTKRRSLN